MNSQQITQILQSNPYTHKFFKGVFSCDTIPSNIQQFPYFFIVNTKPQSHTGEHWQLIWVESPQHAIFFDTFAHQPLNEIAAFLRKFPNISINSTIVQKEWSQACGVYTILWAIQKTRGLTPTKITNNLKQIEPSFIEQLLE